MKTVKVRKKAKTFQEICVQNCLLCQACTFKFLCWIPYHTSISYIHIKRKYIKKSMQFSQHSGVDLTSTFRRVHSISEAFVVYSKSRLQYQKIICYAQQYAKKYLQFILSSKILFRITIGGAVGYFPLQSSVEILALGQKCKHCLLRVNQKS